MALCYVCGSDLTDELVECLDCGTSIEMLHLLARNAANHRFLFGRVQPSDLPDLSATRPEPVARQMRAKPKPEPVPVVRAEPTLFHVDDEPPALFRDEVPVLAPRSFRPTLRTYAYCLDVFLCTLLNAGIFWCILVATVRSLEPLIMLSLIPLLFVMLLFSVLYFGLFQGFFGCSLGRLLIEQHKPEY